MKAIIVLAALAFSTVTHAESKKCEPIGTSRWEEASIEVLQNGAHHLEHIKASGVYLSADLICNFDTCAGFVNGIVVEGSRDQAGGLIINGVGHLPTGEFICEPGLTHP